MEGLSRYVKAGYVQYIQLVIGSRDGVLFQQKRFFLSLTYPTLFKLFSPVLAVYEVDGYFSACLD